MSFPSDNQIAHTALWWFFAVLHLFVAAAWFGAMVYSLTVLHPRARRFFADVQDFEAFISAMAQGARWKVLSALALIGLSGAALIPLSHPHPLTRFWMILIALKIGLLLLAILIFSFVSWRLWPARIFASPAELPAFHRRFAAAALALIVIAAVAMALGVLAHISFL